MDFERKTFDQRPGAVPEIRADGDSVIFCLEIRPHEAGLLIRCSPDGTVSASIATARAGEEGPHPPYYY